MFFKKNDTTNQLLILVESITIQIQELFNSIDRINDDIFEIQKNHYVTEKDLEQYIENNSDIVFTNNLPDYDFIDESTLRNSIENLVDRNDLDQIIETHIMKIEDYVEDSIHEHLSNLSFSNLFKLYILKKLNIK